MKAKIIFIISSLLVSSVCVTQVQAMTTVPGTGVSNPTLQNNENRLGGVVSKISDGKIEINAVTYEFYPKQAQVYDLNGRVNQKADIKVGMFVNFLVIKDKNKARIVEIRLVRK